nr:MAG TPA: Envelope protein [Caudoviricetes sp.]
MLKSKEILQLITIISVELVLELLAFVVVPVALLFCKKDDEHLPKIFRWFEDANDYYNGKCAAINGDSGWREKHYPEPTNRTYKARLLWLLRNKIGRFSSEILGVKVDEVNPYSIETLGDPYIASNGGKDSGFCKVTCVLKNGKKRFGFFRVVRYGKFYCRIYLGWKLMDIAGANALNFKEFTQGDDKKYLKTVWCINPFKRVNQKGE